MKDSNDSHPPALARRSRIIRATAAECSSSAGKSGGSVEGGVNVVIIGADAVETKTCRHGWVSQRQDSADHGRCPPRRRGACAHTARGRREYRASLPPLQWRG